MKPLFATATAFGLSLSCSVWAQEAPMPPTPETLSGRPLEYQNRATLPYEHLIRIAQSDADAKQDAESYKLKIKSKNPLVKGSDIELFLDLEAGPLPLAVDENNFVIVPHTSALVKENPDLVSNQPKRTLDIYVELDVPSVEQPAIKDGKVSYQELFKSLNRIQREMRKVDPNFGLDDQQLVLIVDVGEQPIKITRDLGSRTFQPDEEGKVFMIMESYLYEENPLVEVPDDATINVLPMPTEKVEELRSR